MSSNMQSLAENWARFPDPRSRRGQTYPIVALPLHSIVTTLASGLHYRRDVSFGEDRCRVRISNSPHALAAMRNLAITLPGPTPKTTATPSLCRNQPRFH